MSTTAASIAPKLLELKSKDFTFGQRLCVWECREGAQTVFSESGRGLGHITLQFWHTIEHISKNT